MKRILTLAALAAIAIGFTGCVPITTKFSFTPKNGVTWNNPKDSSFDALEVSESNGVPYMKITGWRSSNNPQVINAAGAADSAIVTAVGTQVIQAMQAGQQMMITQGASSAVQAAVGVGKGTVQGATKALVPTPAAAP